MPGSSAKDVLRSAAGFRRWFLARVRNSDLALLLIAALVGCLAGMAVTGIGAVTQLMHQVLFHLTDNARLSAMVRLDPFAAVLVPALGGLLLHAALQRPFSRPNIVDPIEANALYGGRMSLADSVLVTLQNVLSNGCGASVGLEAGYTQISSSMASALGTALRLRRGDLRTLVGCGAAAAIASAFNAPLAGAFYAFELIISTYSIALLPPVLIAALAGTFTARAFGAGGTILDITALPAFHDSDFVLSGLLGVIAAIYGIAVMQGVTLVEALARRSPLPPLLRPLAGGLVVGLFALVSPQVLASGHGALHIEFDRPAALTAIVLLIVLKSAASAISIGSGFRGGLFFASLLLGLLLGHAFVDVVHLIGQWLDPGLDPGLDPSAPVFAIVGMAALAVVIIGGPMTMTFLALEQTGDFRIVALVLVAVVAASFTARRAFGYSFATWRFHLRGKPIRSAQDVGWLASLTVAAMMRRDFPTIEDTATVGELARRYPPGAERWIVVTDGNGGYRGMVVLADLGMASGDAGRAIGEVPGLVRQADAWLRPEMDVRAAVDAFVATATEALAVVEMAPVPRVVGLLSESHSWRRYAEGLERHRRELAGER